MNKLALIGLSLLVLIIGFGFVSASDIDDSVQAVDHGSMDEISDSDDIDIQHDLSDYSTADDSQNEISDTADAGHTGELEQGTTDLQTQQDTDYSGATYADEFEQSNTASQTTDNLDNAVKINTDANPDVLKDTVNGTVATLDNSTQDVNQTPTTINIVDDTPKETDTSAQKQNLLRPDIEKYNKYFQKHHGQKMANGKVYSEMDLLLEIHKHYSFEDTIIIAMHVLRDNGCKVTFPGLEGMLKAMGDGTLRTYKDEMNASYYKNEMQKIHDFHKSINSEAKKYSDIFNRKNDKLLCDKLSSKYCYLDLITEIYQTHSNIEDTILIATYALKNSGMNVSAASIETTLHQMFDGTVHTDNTEGNTAFYYYYIMSMLKLGHERGVDVSQVHLMVSDI